jgi:hypothetical protein
MFEQVYQFSKMLEDLGSPRRVWIWIMPAPGAATIFHDLCQEQGSHLSFVPTVETIYSPYLLRLKIFMNRALTP